METPHAAYASASSALAGIVASGRVNAPARNNRRSVILMVTTHHLDQSFLDQTSYLFLLKKLRKESEPVFCKRCRMIWAF
jgi:hypothetical protein